jgi:hypothetical protein
LSAPSPFGVAVALPVILTFGVLAYAASLLGVNAGDRPAQGPASTSAIGLVQAPTPLTSEAMIKATQALPRPPKPASEPLAEAVQLRPSHSVKDQSHVGGPDLTRVAEILPPPPKSPAQAAGRDLLVSGQARAVQRRLAELGHFSGEPTGIWGPISRTALRSFKDANDLPSDAGWDVATEQALFRVDARRPEPFVGRWATDVKACSPKAGKGGYLPTVIESNRARAGETSCSFKDKRQTGERWQVTAECAAPRERWTARIQLVVKQDRLTWTSERGSQHYLRCHNSIEVADVVR